MHARMRILVFALVVSCGGGGGAAEPLSFSVGNRDSSLTDSDAITVRGTASGVRSVSVNGVEATTADGFHTWEAVVPLAYGDNELVARARAMDGSEVSQSRLVKRRVVLFTPEWMAWDAAHQRAFVAAESPDRIVSIDGAGARVVAGPTIGTGDERFRGLDGAVDSDGTTLYIRDGFFPGIVAVDTATGNRTTVSSDEVGGGDPFDPRNDMRRILLDEPGGRIIAVRFDDFLLIDLASGMRRAIGKPEGTPVAAAYDAANDLLYTQHSGAGWPIWATHVATGDMRRVGDGPFAVAMVVDAARERLILAGMNGRMAAIDVATGAEELFAAPEVNRAYDLRLDPVTDSVVLLDSWNGLDRILRFALADATESTIWEDGQGSGPRFGLVGDMIWDAAGKRLLVGGIDGSGRVMAVDPVTGDRTMLLEGNTWGGGLALDGEDLVIAAYRSIDVWDTVDDLLATLAEPDDGKGPTFGETEGMAVDSLRGWAWTIDGRTALLRFDLADGSREATVDGFPNLADVVYDPGRDALFVTDRSDRALTRVDPVTGATTTIRTGLNSPGALARHAGMLLVGLGGTQLGAIDPDTGDTRTLSATGSGFEVGFGPALDGIRAIAGDPADPQNVYVVSHSPTRIVRVDLATGDRYLVSK